MRKLNLALFLLGCILVTSFIPAYADNDLAFANKASESIFKEDNSLLKPKRRPVKRGGRRGKKGAELAFQKGNIALELGVGISPFMVMPGLSTSIPPLSLNGEYCFWSGTKSSFGVGALVSYGSMKFNSQDMTLGGLVEEIDSTAKATANFSTLFGAAKITWHYNFSSRVEFFYNFSVGFWNVAFDGKAEDETVAFNYSGPMVGSMLGFKFYFSDNIGMYIELGFDGAKIAGAGLAVKF
jgi:hypothetical protein